MELILILLVATVAVLLLVPEMVKNYELNSPLDTISNFHREMGTLAATTDHYDKNRYYYTPYEGPEPEPYVRQGYFEPDDSNVEDDFVPYPSNRNRIAMETRRNQITALLMFVALGTGVLALVPSMKWALPLHFVMLLVFVVYVSLGILLPSFRRNVR